MKKLTILFILSILFTLPSCNKLPMNGKLDGMWQLIQIDTKEGSNHDVKEQRLYYSVQLKLITLRGMGGSSYILGRFEHSGNSLSLYDFRTGGSEQPCTLENLKPYGLYSLEPKFEVEKLTGSEMVLKSEESTLYFRKF